MIDLDALPDDSFELYCHFGVLLTLGRINYIDWNSSVRALGIHKYVLPDERILVETLLDVVWGRHKKSTTMLMWYSLLMGHVEAHYTESHQVRMLHILMGMEDRRWKNHPHAALPSAIITPNPVEL